MIREEDLSKNNNMAYSKCMPSTWTFFILGLVCVIYKRIPS